VRLPEIDWCEVLPALVAMHANRPGMLVALADVPGNAQFNRKYAGDDAEWLVAEGLLGERAPSGQLVHTQLSRSIRLLYRAARDCKVVDARGTRGTSEAVRRYLARNFTVDQRRVVLEVDSTTPLLAGQAALVVASAPRWSREFLKIEDPEAFDEPRAGREYGETLDPLVHRMACVVMREAALAPLQVPVGLPAPDGDLLPRAIAAAIRYLLLFPRLEDGVLSLGLLPGAADVILKSETEPPMVVSGNLLPPHLFAVEDAEAVFVHACTHPIRVKASGTELYQRDMDDISSKLPPVPTGASPELRVVTAVYVLARLGALENAETVASRRCLQATPAGHRWLSAGLAERLEPFLVGVRANSYAERLDQLRLLDYFYYYDSQSAQALWRGLMNLYDSLPHEGSVKLADLVAYHSCCHFPLSDELQSYGRITEDGWGMMQLKFLFWLASLGGIAVVGAGEEIHVAATPMGDYVLGLREEPPSVEKSDARVIVQANFEVVFLGPSPAAQGVMARFSDRADAGPVGTLFRITPESVMRAGAAGVTFDDIERDLRAHVEAVPPNVLHEIGVWISRVRRVSATSGIVVQCPDVETADRIEAESRGKDFTRIGETVLVATDRKAFDRVARKLAARGIVFDLDLTADAALKKKRAKPRRRRRW